MGVLGTFGLSHLCHLIPSALLCPPWKRRSASKDYITWAPGPLASIWVQPISGGDQSTAERSQYSPLSLPGCGSGRGCDP